MNAPGYFAALVASLTYVDEHGEAWPEWQISFSMWCARGRCCRVQYAGERGWQRLASQVAWRGVTMHECSAGLPLMACIPTLEIQGVHGL